MSFYETRLTVREYLQKTIADDGVYHLPVMPSGPGYETTEVDLGGVPRGRAVDILYNGLYLEPSLHLLPATPLQLAVLGASMESGSYQAVRVLQEVVNGLMADFEARINVQRGPCLELDGFLLSSTCTLVNLTWWINDRAEFLERYSRVYKKKP